MAKDLNMKISLEALANFVSKEEVCFQLGDSLPEFTNTDENRKQLLEEIKASKSAKITDKKVHTEFEDIPFVELNDWSTESDLLILLDEWVLICIPYTELVEWCFVEK